MSAIDSRTSTRPRCSNTVVQRPCLTLCPRRDSYLDDPSRVSAMFETHEIGPSRAHTRVYTHCCINTRGLTLAPVLSLCSLPLLLIGVVTFCISSISDRFLLAATLRVAGVRAPEAPSPAAGSCHVKYHVHIYTYITQGRSDTPRYTHIQIAREAG